MRTFDKPISIQRKDIEKRQWITLQNLHAHVNTTASSEYTTAGSSRSSYSLTFTVRYNPELAQIAFALHDYRIIWQGRFFKITSYDDYNMQHATVKLVADGEGLAPSAAAQGGESHANT